LEKEQKKFDNEKKSLSDEYKTIFKKIEQNEKTILSEVFFFFFFQKKLLINTKNLTLGK